MRDLYIFALHLAYGGIEKAVSIFANSMAKEYKVHIISVYQMPCSPAYPIDERVTITYLRNRTPNRHELLDALKKRNIPEIIKQGVTAAYIIAAKKISVIRSIRKINSGIIVTTRDEHAVLLSRYGKKQVLKIAQFHQDHNFERKFVFHFKYCYGNIDIFSLLSPKMASEVSKIMIDNRHTVVKYVPNYIESMPEEADIDVKIPEVLAVGRLDPVKGFDRLIQCFAVLHEKFPEWKLKIVGDGDEYSKLSDMIAKYDAAEYIELAGRFTPEQVEEEMKRASVYAMSSYSEGFPFVLLEAMSNSLPVVAFETRSGLSMMIRQGENGYLVNRIDEFTDRLKELMNDTELRRKMAKQSRDYSLNFSEKTVSEQWISLIEGRNYAE